MKESKGEERESGGRSEKKIKKTKYKIIITMYIYIVIVVKM